jgi:predicted permease
LLGISAFLGRTLTEEDDRAAGASPVAILAYRYWQREFGSDTNVIGKKIELQGYPFTVVGVTPPDFFGLEPGKEVDITVPLMMQPVVMPGSPLLTSSSARWLRLVGRRKPGVSARQAQANLALRWGQVLAATPRPPGAPASRLELLSGSQGLYDLRRQFSLPLRLLMAAVVLVLLVACANLAGLLIARATARQQEIGVRLSLGASRSRLVRQFLTESMVLSVMGGICGMGFSYWGAQLLVEIMSHGRVPIALNLTLHTRTLLFTGIVSLASGLLLGVAPAFSSTSAGAVHGVRIIAGQPRRWAAAFIISQVSLCVVVLACTGLVWGSLKNLRQIDPGFRKDHVLLMSIRPALSNYNDQRGAQLYGELCRRFKELTGVKSVTVSMDAPLGGVSYTAGASRLGSPEQLSGALQVNVNSVGSQFFETMGIPLLMGHDLNTLDGGGGPQVAVISESVARSLFPGGSPLGKRIKIGASSMEIVGVAKDTRYQSLREPPHPMVYRPYLQMQGTWEELFFGIRTVGDPETLAARCGANFVRRHPTCWCFR